MKNYDTEKAREIIANNADGLESVSMGMHEDWFWTAETIYEDGEFSASFLALEKGEKFGGIFGSSWATPALCLQFKDGTEKWISCFSGESEADAQSPVPMSLMHGALSAPAQANIPPLETES